MTTPAGYPLWHRSVSAANYGGSAAKRDYGNIGAVNANTDVTAAQYMRLVCDAAAVAMTAPLLTFSVTHEAGGFYVDWAQPLWAPRTTTRYLATTPPSSLYPEQTAYTSTSVTMRLPISADDEYGVTGDIALTMVVPFTFGITWVPVDTRYFTLDGIGVGESTVVMVF